MIVPFAWVVACGVSAGAATAASLDAPVERTVAEDPAFVFAEPSLEAAVLRRVYIGEVLRVAREVVADDGRRWSEVTLGAGASGFVESVRLAEGPGVPAETYLARHVQREEHPIAIGLEVGGKTFGAALALRYQRFSRLSAVLSYGSVITADGGGAAGARALVAGPSMHGTVLSAGIASALLLSNLSPVVEVGLSRLDYRREQATLQVTSLYASAGVEWISPGGIFVGASLTYVRSLDVAIAFAMQDARRGDIAVPGFGALDPGEDGVLESAQPAVVVGVAF